MNKLLTCVLFVTLLGCTTYPDKKHFTYEECFQEAVCKYYKSKEPSVDCSASEKRCSDVRLESRVLKRYQYCGQAENRWENKDAQTCWDKLNSK